ncbi:hypothetical protein [Aromatoleum petrolei]|uniref:DUF4124 domain-containing protein n=1 Tax=Aromatoleum petrolei TaxID=76116 RepID=A0ABX1MPT7_9RHOO|nr:hypothetical protein [Aromatoleum petrolei]NMF89963.1 hypothetical protein [Aromatoleum petrolei]QTQ36404.1 Uncharacterized protein ToN1_22610 [Aromatoleum petrolei]
MASRRSPELLVALLLGLTLANTAGAKVYCCEDASGRRQCGDVLPQACYGRAYREMGPQGTIKREVSAPLTADEIARRNAAEQQKKDDETRQAKQRRLDQALLETYASVEDLDRRRDKDIADIERSLEEARKRDKELRTKRQRFEKEAEFHKGRDLPRDLAANLRSIDSELALQGKLVEDKTRELEATRARFEADRARYVELSSAAAKQR